MGLSYVPAISTGLLLPTGILQQIGLSLNDTVDILWIPGGWSVASAVSFSIAGGLSDIFGRRWVLMFGQFLTLIGGVSFPTSLKDDLPVRWCHSLLTSLYFRLSAARLSLPSSLRPEPLSLALVLA